MQQTEFEGEYVQSRRIGDYVYAVVNHGETSLPLPELICDDDNSCVYESQEAFVNRVTNNFESIVSDVLPSYVSYGSDGEIARSGQVIQPEDIFKPLDDDADSMVSVLSINMSNNEPGMASIAAVMTSGATEIYGSLENLYLFETRHAWQTEDSSTTTRILKFAWNDDEGNVSFVSTGSVPGQMIGQFAADEYDGHLRIATTIGNRGAGNYSGQDENALFVLNDDLGVLEFTGSTQNLALGESIQSVRFFNDKAFAVTFRNIDPLYGIDLSDHADPRAVGHLALPGVSSYLQFIDDDKLLTVGRNNGASWLGGANVSLFNVADLLEPVLVDQYQLPLFSFSEAATDHHAFGWFSRHETLAVPTARSYQERVDDDNDGYAETIVYRHDHELFAFNIDASLDERDDEGIELSGKVAHGLPVRRSIYIEDVLYSIGDDMIIAVDVQQPENEIGRVEILAEEAIETPEPEDKLARLESIQAAALSDLSAREQLGAGEIMTVTSESIEGDRVELVLRNGESNYLYRSNSDGTVDYVSDEFAFGSGKVEYDWHNESLPTDTTNDGQVNAIDALWVINDLNRNGARRIPSESVVRQILEVPGMLDVSGDGLMTALDALMIINKINEQNAQTSSSQNGATVLFETQGKGAEADTDASNALVVATGAIDQRSQATRDRLLASAPSSSVVLESSVGSDVDEAIQDEDDWLSIF